MRPGDQEKLADLLASETSEAELERLLEFAEQDPEASQEVDFLADLSAAIEAEEEHLERRIPARPGDLRALTRDSANSSKRPRGLGYLVGGTALAVALALVLLMLRLPSSPPSTEAAAGLAPPSYVPMTLRSDASSLEQTLSRAMLPYIEGDYVEARQRLEKLVAEHPEHSVGHFYLAASQEALAEYADAARSYAACADGSGGMLHEHALWRLANLELRMGSIEQARDRLQGLQRSGKVFTTNAKQLLEEIGQ